MTISSSYGNLDTRSAVGHLTRNIKIISGDDSGWGYRLLGYARLDGTRVRKGHLIL